MQRLIFLHPAETDPSYRHRVLLATEDDRIKLLLDKILVDAGNLGNVVIFTSHVWAAMVTGAEIFYRVGGGPALAKVPQLGDEHGQTVSNSSVMTWFASVSSMWDTVFFVSHTMLIEKFPPYWMEKILKVEKPPEFHPDITQAIFIDIPSKKAKLI